MNYNDSIGTFGVSLILLAYFLTVFGLLTNKNKIFYQLNIMGAVLACYASWLILYWPFVVLEGVWCLISVIGLLKSIQLKKTTG
jgi:hypothetical protein